MSYEVVLQKGEYFLSITKGSVHAPCGTIFDVDEESKPSASRVRLKVKRVPDVLHIAQTGTNVAPGDIITMSQEHFLAGNFRELRM